MREDLDQPHRWLLLLSALVFLQIYAEETHTCTGWVVGTEENNLSLHLLFYAVCSFLVQQWV